MDWDVPRLFTVTGFSIVVLTGLQFRFGSRLPAILQYSFLYGKYEPVQNRGYKALQIPKSYFTFFYVAGALFTALALFLELISSDPHLTILWTLGLYLIHVCRRLYECLFVCVQSKARMSVTHLILGIAFYVVTPFSIYNSRSQAASRSPWIIVLFTIVFALIQLSQHLACRQLADLRKLSPASVSANRYLEPRGSMFQLITCPHFLFEIALYLVIHLFLTLSWIPFSHMLLFVLTNQLCAARLNHAWYLERFPDWAASRWALIPYVC